MQKDWIKQTMTKFPFVVWDRYIPCEDYIEVYGWIKNDFILLEFDLKNKTVTCPATSSAKYSKKICDLLNIEHIDCVPIIGIGWV